MENNPNLKIIHPEAEIDEESFIDAFTVIGRGVTIEKDAYISRGVKIYGKSIIKAGTYIGENCIIGHPQKNNLVDIVKNKKQVIDLEGPLVTINNECIIRAGTIIYSEVTLGEKCQTGHNTMIREKTTIDNNTLIGTNCIIDGCTSIGSNVSIQTGVYIPLFSTIGNNVFLGPYCKLTNDKYMMRKDFELIGPTIEDHVSLGANSVIFPGITVRNGTLVGAGAIVTKDTKEREIIVGNPARLLKKVPHDWK